MRAGRAGCLLAPLCTVLLLATGNLAGQSPAAGRLLIASREVSEPAFAETVILLVRVDQGGVMGLVLNRPSTVPLSRALDQMENAKGRSDPVYVGGPVGRTGVLALLRARTSPAGATRILDGVYLISTKESLDEALARRPESTELRVYLGYSGWSPGRLERELSLGIWHVAPGSAGIVFHSDPASLWERLLPDPSLKLARLQ